MEAVAANFYWNSFLKVPINYLIQLPILILKKMHKNWTSYVN